MATPDTALLQQLSTLNEHELHRLLAEHLTSRKLGLTWERDVAAQVLSLHEVLTQGLGASKAKRGP